MLMVGCGIHYAAKNKIVLYDDTICNDVPSSEIIDM